MNVAVRAVAKGDSRLLQRHRIEILGRTSRGIVLDTIKRGEDDSFEGTTSGEKTVILRLYEGLGGRAKGRLSL